MSTEHHLQVSRTARYFALGDAAPPPREVWVVCHGYGQLAAPFLETFEPLDDGSRLIVAPEALSRFYLDGINHPPDARVGASWMTREDRLNEMDDYVAYLDLLHDTLFERVRRETVKLVVLGFSQGTATASRWAVRGAARADRLVLWAGLLPPDVEPASLRDKLNAVDLVLVAGAKDRHITPERLAEQRAALERAGVRHRVVTFEGGHALEASALARLAQL